jgi:CheY-like chemotaxis protein
MAIEFELLRPEDKPALLALSTPEFLDAARAALEQLDYKVHVAANPEEFLTRFARVQYHVVILEEGFGGATAAENAALQDLQRMPMNLRRHAGILLLGNSFQSLNPMQAYQQSVHAVVNPAELSSLGQIVQKVVADNTLFLHIYRDTQQRIVAGKL